MHEWALAESVVSAVLKTAEEQKFQSISEIAIKLGQLQQIEADILKFALEEIIRPQKKMFGNTALKLQTEQALLQCNACGKTMTKDDFVFICIQCGSQDLKTLSGTELILQKMGLEI